MTHLKPSFQGYRLVNGEYVRILPIEGRLPSEVVGLHLERHGDELKLYDPATGKWLLDPEEKVAQEALARQQESLARQLAEAERWKSLRPRTRSAAPQFVRAQP